MTKLGGIVRVERRFARSARIDSDLNGTPPLAGYVLQPSVRKALETMVQAIAESRQAAFTWTGPYGGGKSCAALLVANLVGGQAEQRKVAKEIVGPELVAAFAEAFPGKGKWPVVALTGRRASLREELATAAGSVLDWSKTELASASRDEKALCEILRADSETHGGLLIIIDELGKFFEHAALDGGDIHILQDLAELAARSDGKLVIAGILHQSFAQYAGRLTRAARDEWAKIQGRFLDIPFAAGPDEVAALLARAIDCDATPADARERASVVAKAIGERRPVDEEALTETLAASWPLHPVTALILGPVSRQRFAQNERSVFGFLTSAEPHGFQAYLDGTELNEAGAGYTPDRLWDYLVANYGLELTAGQDGARVSLAMEAIERAAVLGETHACIAKIAALIELFRNGSGLSVSDAILGMSMPELRERELQAALEELVGRAVLMRQPRLGGYALFAGSDFDLEDAVNRLREPLSAEAIADLPAQLGIGPIAAKRHYFERGTLRTFDVVLHSVDETVHDKADWIERTRRTLGRRKAPGLIVTLLPEANVDAGLVRRVAEPLARALAEDGIIAAIGTTKLFFLLREHVAELFALDRVQATHPQLEGDRIARRELASRRAQAIDSIRRELVSVIHSCQWSSAEGRMKELEGRALSFIASEIADRTFKAAPTLHSELLNRDKPSSSAMAAARALGYAMVEHEAKPDLGFDGFPAELGLYLTVVKPFGLHRKGANGVWRFHDPAEDGVGTTLLAIWEAFKSGPALRLSDIYAGWARAPFGLKRGVMPIFALAYLLAHRDSVAVYVDGLYQTVFDTTFVDKVLQAPAAVEVRAISRSESDAAFLDRLALALGDEDSPVEAKALPVASALFRHFVGLPEWTKRTTTLSDATRQARDAVLKANDPESLLFKELPAALKGSSDRASAVIAAVLETGSAYRVMLDRLRLSVAERLAVDAESFEGIGVRATNAIGITADLRFDAFAMRVGAFESADGDIEGLASLLVHKPPRNWSDRDHDLAAFEMAKLAQRFREAEAMAELRGRQPTAQAISIMVGLDPATQPLRRAFHVSPPELETADRLAQAILGDLKRQGLPEEVELAALARAFEHLQARTMEAAE